MRTPTPAILANGVGSGANYWLQVVNKPQSEAELEALRRSVSRGRPYGSEVWVQDIVQRLGLQATIRPRGRPRKRPPAGPDGDDN